MRNPFKSEDAAFRFVLGTIAYFALIVIASQIATWFGLVVFLVLTGVAVVWLRGGGPSPPPREHVEHGVVEDTWRILLLANQTLPGEHLRAEIVRMADGVAEDVLVICPALNSRGETRASDEDGARAAAEVRLAATLDALRGDGISVRGAVGDGDPLQALEDGLRGFSADAIVISTHPEGSSNWLERGVIETVRARYDVPVTHIVGNVMTVEEADPSSLTPDD